jgi:excisionase family DNA binding protein
MDPIAVDVNTAAKMTSLSPHTIRLYVRKGRLRVSRVGRRLLVPIESLRTLVRDGMTSCTEDETGDK